MIFAVTSCREYANDERYFGCDGLFATEGAAKAYVLRDMQETLHTCSEEAWCDGLEIHDGTDLYIWKIEAMEVQA